MDEPLREMDYGEEHQLAAEDLFIGAETSEYTVSLWSYIIMISS